MQFPLPVLLMLAVVTSGCTPRVVLKESEGDQLRARTLELEDQVRDLQRRNAELEARLAPSGGALSGDAAEIEAATPLPVELIIGRLSHARDADGDGAVDELVVYVEPRDGRGRFVQVVGTLAVHAAVLPAEGEAHTIGRVALGPLGVREAYRSSFMGTHYTLTVPIDASSGHATCTVRVVFTDGPSGRTLEAQRAVNLAP